MGAFLSETAPRIVLRLLADDLHNKPCAEDEALAEAVISHRADQLVVDVGEFQQALLRLAVEQFREPLFVLPERFEQDAGVGAVGVVSLVGTQLAVVEMRNLYETRQMQYLGRTPEAWRDSKPLAKVCLTIPCRASGFLPLTTEFRHAVAMPTLPHAIDAYCSACAPFRRPDNAE